MKILQINAFNYQKGGSETVYRATSAELERLGYSVVRFAMKWPENEPDRNEDLFPDSKTTRTGKLRPIINAITYFYNREAARNLQKLIDRERPDIAQIHLIWGQLTPSILKVLKRNGIPTVLTAHDYRLVCPAYTFRNGKGEICEQCEGRRYGKCVSNRCCKGSRGLSLMMASEQRFRNAFFNPAKLLDGIIFVSDFAQRKHLQYFPELERLDNIQLYNFSPYKAEAKERTAKERYFLYAGRLSEEKGLWTAIKAFERRPESRLIIAGTGPLEEELKAYVETNKLRNIEFVGFKTGDNLKTLVENAYFVIVPSEWYENNPMSIVESYSLATPVIGSRIGGIPEIVVDGSTGFLFDAFSTEALEETVEKAEGLTDKQYLDMRREAADFAATNFDKDRYMRTLIEYFKRLTDKNRTNS